MNKLNIFNEIFINNYNPIDKYDLSMVLYSNENYIIRYGYLMM